MKVAICTPLYSDPKATYTGCLVNLVMASRVDLRYFFGQHSIVAHGREQLAAEAMEWGAVHLLWLDSDQIFPPDALSRLLAHNEPFVGCNYSRRGEPAGPTAKGLGGEPLWTSLDAARARKVEEVEGLGFGVCLTAASVFEKVQRPWFDAIAEDYDFCRKARSAGFRILVDHHLSWEIGHVGERIYTNADAMLDRPRWKMKHKQ